MKRVIAAILLTLLAAGGLLWPLAAAKLTSKSSSGVDDPVVVTNYTATYNVAANGNLDATEVVTGKFPGGRHGIFRFWDLVDPSDPHVRYRPQIKSITMDGQPVKVSYSWQEGDRFYVAKIGDPDSYVTPGSHAYTLAYSVPDAISPISAGAKEYVSSQGTVGAGSQSDFYWNVVAQGWQMAIQQANIQVNLPSPSGQVQCTVGVPVSSTLTESAAFAAKTPAPFPTPTSPGYSLGPCGIKGAGTNQLTLTASNIPPRSGMTVRATMVPPPPAITASVPWSISWDPILGTNAGLVGIVIVVTIITGAVGALLAFRAREANPGFPVMYAPPNGLGPVQTVYIDSEEIGAHGLTSSLFYLADKRLVTLERREDDTWLLTGQGTPEQWAAIDPVSRGVAEDLGVTNQGFWFLADRSKGAGQVLVGAKGGIHRAAVQWADGQGLAHSVASEKLAKAAWVLCVLGAVAGFIGWLGPTMVGLPFAGYLIGGIGLMRPGVGTRRTQTGRRLWSEAGGFKRLLTTDSSEARFDFSANKDLFISFIPYAVAFGVADLWAAKYKVATGQDAPLPFWYPYGYGMWGSPYSSGGGFDGFDSAVSASISSYQASQSSSSGGGGGGFGGGGGGGGGGSW